MEDELERMDEIQNCAELLGHLFATTFVFDHDDHWRQDTDDPQHAQEIVDRLSVKWTDVLGESNETLGITQDDREGYNQLVLDFAKRCANCSSELTFFAND